MNEFKSNISDVRADKQIGSQCQLNNIRDLASAKQCKNEIHITELNFQNICVTKGTRTTLQNKIRIANM
jgi:hypothetical protein